MPLNYIEVGYDKIQLATGTRAEIEANKDKLNTYETAIVTDEDQLVYKDANGDIKDFTTGELEKVKEDIAKNSEDIAKNAEDIEQNKSDILLKRSIEDYNFKDSKFVEFRGLGSDGSMTLSTSSVEGKYRIGFTRKQDFSDGIKNSLLLGDDGTIFIECKDDNLPKNISEEVFTTAMIKSLESSEGYVKVGKFLFQWGSVFTGTSGELVTVTFPIAFTRCYWIAPICASNVPSGSFGSMITAQQQHYQEVTGTSFKCYRASSFGKKWIAIGY